jgi:alpha-ketoglutarate-dependent taurine dioxygenase
MQTLEVSVVPGKPAVLRLGDPALLGAHRPAIDDLIAEHGAVLVRGLGLRDRAAAMAAISQIIRRPFFEREGFAPRERYAEGFYSSSAWPPDQPMCMHHEVSYAQEVPALLAFCCLTAPRDGGVTGLADARLVLRDLPAELVEPFERQGWELVRSYNEFVGVPWQDAFGEQDPAAVEKYCRDNDIEFRWDPDGGLRTRQRRAAVVRHPRSGERCWFNQIAFLNEWTMDPAVREYLVAEFGDDGLPFTTNHGDGTPLDVATVDQINEVYERHTVREPWQQGDLLLVDNIRTAHSREPHSGDREILVAMGEPTRV